MRAYVGMLSRVLVTTTMRFNMALRCCLLLVPCGVDDIDPRVLGLLVEASPLRTLSAEKFKVRVSTESLATLVVELFAKRRLDECQEPKVALAVLNLLADRLQRDTSKPASAGSDAGKPPAPTEPVRERVEQALRVLTSKIDHRTLQADWKRWREYRRGLKRYLPAASPLLGLLLGHS
jgi:hypothetical protein